MIKTIESVQNPRKTININSTTNIKHANTNKVGSEFSFPSKISGMIKGNNGRVIVAITADRNRKGKKGRIFLSKYSKKGLNSLSGLAKKFRIIFFI